MQENDKKNADARYQEFLSDLGEFGAREEEKAFMDSIAPQVEKEDIPLKVGQRIRSVREKRGLSLENISERTGIDTLLLSQIEAGQIAPPLGTVIKLAKALDMKMGYFISGEEEKPYTIVRKGERRVVSRYDAKKAKRYGYEYESLAPQKKDRHMEPFLVTLEPADTEEERSSHAGQEFIFVLAGRMEVRLGKEVHILEPGDAIYYDSTVPHLVKCFGPEKTEILAVLYAEE
ncbi:MAG: cupin domain-containing protein [Deltaproteobacteria bacterium]|nr:cupin domain-containing protein [Deltaproteobacteria bacterium]MBW1935546.1 cupin domain-containing protein [Deltaproteobacteria bacterium]MBW1977257.1 cupin domain-containing protein [Deltaproteobacteria bacterium]MBW2043851.1 cupin domain-containing protein [Deltaproteobacteria bacterium]MBW2300975.1 cupin domain-containing protein [Deltaproteobacteria bacterium]